MATVNAYTKAGADTAFAKKDLSDSATQTALQAYVGGNVLPEHAVAPRPNRYEALAAVYNWKSSNTRRILAALSRASYPLISAGSTSSLSGVPSSSFVCIGDGSTSTVDSGGGEDLSWPRLLPEAWVHIPANLVRGFIPAVDGPTGTTDTSLLKGWTLSGSWTNNVSYLYSNSSGSSLTISSTEDTTSVDVWYYGNSGTFSISVDGGTPVSPAVTGLVEVKKYTITGLTAGLHSVVITSTEATAAKIIGIRFSTDVAPTISVSNIASYGTSAADWLASTGTGGPVTYLATLDSTPDAVFVCLGAEDIADGTLSTFKANITTLRGQFPNSDVVLVTPPEQSAWSAGDTSTLYQYLYDLADSLDVPLLDWRDVLGTYTEANAAGFMSSTTSVSMLASAALVEKIYKTL